MKHYSNNVFLVDAARTPFLKAKKRGPLSAADFGVKAAQGLMARLPVPPDQLDQLIAGCVIPAPNEANIARLIALRLGCGYQVPAYTVQRNCASGLQAVDSAYQAIASGQSDLVMAIGTEAMSHAPFMASPAHMDWLYDLAYSRGMLASLLAILKLRFSWLFPQSSLLLGLKDPLFKLSMGQTAEIIADEFSIQREESDDFACYSHQRAAQAQLERELLPLLINNEWVNSDTGIRSDSDRTKLARLKPQFEKHGQVTAGNSSQITDGASAILLASHEAVERWGLEPLATVGTCYWQALDPSHMGLGPAHSIAALMHDQKLSMGDIDLFEINEAFSAQVLACREALNNQDFCRKTLGLPDTLGLIPMDKLNVEGGAIALGHPIGASGARLVGHMAHLLQKRNLNRGVISLCVGGGQGGALVVNRWQG